LELVEPGGFLGVNHGIIGEHNQEGSIQTNEAVVDG
jgi:hypothetical protein